MTDAENNPIDFKSAERSPFLNRKKKSITAGHDCCARSAL